MLAASIGALAWSLKLQAGEGGKIKIESLGVGAWTFILAAIGGYVLGG